MNDLDNHPLRGASVLVTGGNGFIGAPLCASLRDLGARVLSVSRSGKGHPEGVHGLRADLADLTQTRSAVQAAKPDYVVHLASHVLGRRAVDVVPSTLASNLVSTVNLLVAAHEHNCRRVVLTGSLEEPDPDSDWPIPSSPYAAAKLGAAAYGRMFNALFELPVVILRVFMVYGPGQSDLTKLIPYVTTSLLDGKAPTFTSGTREVDWIFVQDVVDAYVASLTAPDIAGKTIEVGSGTLHSVRQIVEKLFALLSPESQPYFGGVSDRPMEQVRRADTDTAETLLAWRTRVGIDEGLRATVDWYRNNYPENRRDN